jgi:hypothetical protein
MLAKLERYESHVRWTCVHAPHYDSTV